MSDFIPNGHWDFNTTLDAVGKHLFGDAWDWQEPEAPTLPSAMDFLTGQASFADAARLNGSKDTAGPSDPALLDPALDWLRQRLHANRLPSYVLAQTGKIKPVPFSEWGRTDIWDNAVSSERIEFMENWGPVGGPIPGTISGRVLFRITDVEKALSSGRKMRKIILANEGRCQAWLVDLMKSGPPDRNKRDYEKEAASKFKVGPRAFSRAWANAIKETGNTDWSTPGPKS